MVTFKKKKEWESLDKEKIKQEKGVKTRSTRLLPSKTKKKKKHNRLTH